VVPQAAKFDTCQQARAKRQRGFEPARLRRYGALLCLLGTLAGCVHYHAAPLNPEHSADDFAARRLTEIQLRDELVRRMPQTLTTWPPREWDRAELLAVALTRNPRLAVARAQIGAAQSREITAAEAPTPDLTLQSEYARHDAHPWLYGISLNWLLRSPERRRLDSAIAGLDTGNARLQLMDQAWAVRSALAAALSDWESGRRRLSLLARLAAAQDRLLTLERQRVSAGEDSPTEVVTAEQARIQIDRQEAEVREAIDAAQAAAAKALGLPPQALDEVAFVWPDWGEPPPVDEDLRRETREQALLSRADLGQAIGDYAAAESKLQLSVPVNTRSSFSRRGTTGITVSQSFLSMWASRCHSMVTGARSPRHAPAANSPGSGCSRCKLTSMARSWPRSVRNTSLV
jgi:outer membrane protein TolC